MPALIDTHAFLWLTGDQTRLSDAALAYLRDAQNRLLLSVASAWEIAIKHGKGRLELDIPLSELLADVPSRLSVDLLPITPAHLVQVATLPEHHRDPFDRLLIAQCLVEQLPLVSADGVLDAYGIQRIW